MVVKKFIAGIFTGVYRMSLASHKRFTETTAGRANKHTGHHIGMVPEFPKNLRPNQPKVYSTYISFEKQKIDLYQRLIRWAACSVSACGPFMHGWG
jgi:hypothetical protein